MGRLLVVLLCAFACALPAAAAPPKHPPPKRPHHAPKPKPKPKPKPRPTVTLKAPAVTTYLHSVDFAGRFSPSRPGTRVTLTSAGRFVAATALRLDGTFRFTFAVASPGPFQAQAAGASSRPVTVQLVPTLTASLAGSRVLGEPLHVVASLAPSAAGTIQVRVLRGGGAGFVGAFHGAVRAQLGTTSLEPFDVRISTVPRPGFRPLATSLHVELVPPHLGVGTTGPAVTELARRLAALHYFVPSFSESYGYDLVESVYAFQKVEGLSRTGEVDPGVWTRLEHASVPRPRYQQPADHIEVDKARQVLFIVRDGEVAGISPVSTAGIPGYFTPVGTFGIYRKVNGYDTSPLGVLLNPMYFVGGYAIHGNPSVPPYPASHGCVRVPNFVIYRLFGSEPYGETVYVY